MPHPAPKLKLEPSTGAPDVCLAAEFLAELTLAHIKQDVQRTSSTRVFDQRGAPVPLVGKNLSKRGTPNGAD
jgi:hypothetical protein